MNRRVRNQGVFQQLRTYVTKKRGGCTSRQCRSARIKALYTKAQQLLSDNKVSSIVITYSQNEQGNDTVSAKPFGQRAQEKLFCSKGVEFLEHWRGDAELDEETGPENIQETVHEIPNVVVEAEDRTLGHGGQNIVRSPIMNPAQVDEQDGNFQDAALQNDNMEQDSPAASNIILVSSFSSPAQGDEQQEFQAVGHIDHVSEIIQAVASAAHEDVQNSPTFEVPAPVIRRSRGVRTRGGRQGSQRSEPYASGTRRNMPVNGDVDEPLVPPPPTAPSTSSSLAAADSSLTTPALISTAVDVASSTPALATSEADSCLSTPTSEATDSSSSIQTSPTLTAAAKHQDEGDTFQRILEQLRSATVAHGIRSVSI